MPRSIWKGSITFGLVNIPVGLYGAESRHELQFHLLDKRDKSPVHYKRVSEASGKEVPWGDIVRGYEYEHGQYVILSDEDLQHANPAATQTIDITDFVDAAEISPVYFDKPYFLAPDKKGTKGYALLREALRRSGKVGIASVVIRTRQYLAAVLPQDDVLVLELLRYAHELRDAADLEVPRGGSEVSDRELAMAEKLIDAMAGAWEPAAYADTYEKDVMEMIERRVESGETEAVETKAPKRPAAGGKVVDLMMLLQRSVDESGGKGAGTKKKTAAPAVPARRRAAPRAATKAKPHSAPKARAERRKSA
jgi:DNA end-binding protein Ku